MSLRTTYKRLKVFFNSIDSGFSETYNLDDISYALAETRSVLLIDARRTLLGNGLTIPYAVISEIGNPKDGMAPNGYGFVPLADSADAVAGTPDKINDPGTGLLWYFDTGLGFGVNRLFRGVRDTIISDNKTTLTLNGGAYAQNGPYLGGTAPPTYTAQPTGDAPADNWNNFIALARDLTFLVRPAPLTPATPYNVVPFEVAVGGGVSYVRVGHRDVGKRWSPSKGRQPAYA